MSRARPAAAGRVRAAERRTCTKCGDTKSRRSFRGTVCLVCLGHRFHARPRAEVQETSPMTALFLRGVVAPSPAELEAVEECVRLICASAPKGVGGNNEAGTGSAPAGPEAVIDAAAKHWVRRIQLGSLALQMVRER